MNDVSKIKYVSEIDMDDKNLQVKKPFKITSENTRRFIRLEISSPISMVKVKETLKKISFQEDDYNIHGTILNISASGVLVELNEPFSEADIVLMRFTLQDVETLSNVLGVIKRVEHDEDCYLTGIEFVTLDYLSDKMSKPEIDLLAESVSNFEQKVQDVLCKYLYHEKQDGRA